MQVLVSTTALLAEGQSAFAWIGGLLLGIVAFVGACALLGYGLKGAAEGLDEVASTASDAIKKTDWYVARQEKKEIEALERKARLKELKEKVDD